jgi:EF hand
LETTTEGRAMKFRIALIALALSSAAAPALAQVADFAARIRSYDADGDGRVTREEARTARGAMFARLDADHDGTLSAAERPGAQAPGMGADQLRRADTNHDGALSHDEFLGMPYRAFDLFDANHDNVLDAAELNVIRGAASR